MVENVQDSHISLLSEFGTGFQQAPAMVWREEHCITPAGKLRIPKALNCLPNRHGDGPFLLHIPDAPEQRRKPPIAMRGSRSWPPQIVNC
jgi:hypothetical protein